jgi:hypothetical protein
MGISILEPPLSRSILWCDRARYVMAGERVLRRLPIEDEAQAEDPKPADTVPIASESPKPSP